MLCSGAGRQSEAFWPVVRRRHPKDSSVQASLGGVPASAATDIRTALELCLALVCKFGGLAFQLATEL